MATQQNPDGLETLSITNWKGSMTSYVNGDVNSGLSNVVESSGQDPFIQPGSLTWMETAVQIDPTGSVITDLIMAMKPRNEGGIVYVYAIGSAGRVYKIQVNNPATYNPDYDNPVLLTTLTINTPTFTRGGFLDFYGATQKIYISHDQGLTSLNFDGTGEAAVGTTPGWIQNVPKPLCQFVGKLYIGNGNNFAEVDSTLTVTTYAKLSPSFPAGTQTRDLDVTPDGVYIQAVVAELALGDITTATPDTSILAPSNSYIFKWNGTDTGYTSYVTYPSVALSANAIFGNSAYAFGFDFLGGAIYNPDDKWLSSAVNTAFTESPFPNAVISISNLITWFTPLLFEGNLTIILSIFGTISGYEIERGYWCTLFQNASGTETDVNHIPAQCMVSNFAQGSSFSGYPQNNFGTAKLYFSTVESSSAPTTKYKLYKFSPAPTGLGAAQAGLYQTQTQLFSKKIQPKSIRIYGEPWASSTEFTIDLIGSNNLPIPGCSKTFTAGTNLTVGTDFAWYTPAGAPTYAIALRVTNSGSANNVINKVEIDYTIGGQ